MDDPLNEAWQHVLAHWDDSAAHRRFLILADTQGDLAEAGALYRAIRVSDPTRAPDAAKRIDEILGLALAKMKTHQELQASDTRFRAEWAKRTLTFIALCFVIGAAFYFFQQVAMQRAL